MRPRLKLYTGDCDTTAVAEPQVSMRLGEVTRILMDAVRWDRTWLRDLEDDEIQVSADLYEILSAYTHLRPSA
jgi:hypothetical protein